MCLQAFAVDELLAFNVKLSFKKLRNILLKPVLPPGKGKWHLIDTIVLTAKTKLAQFFCNRTNIGVAGSDKHTSLLHMGMIALD